MRVIRGVYVSILFHLDFDQVENFPKLKNNILKNGAAEPCKNISASHFQEELQAQFRKIQQQDASHVLSQRNCVELIMRLIDLQMINVIFTLNGREYLTPKQLENEIQDEILQHRGKARDCPDPQ